MNRKFFYKSFSYLSVFFLFFFFFSDLIREPGLLPTVLICTYLVGCVFVMSSNILSSLCVVALGINTIKIGSFYKMQYLGNPIAASDIFLTPYLLNQQKMLQAYYVEAIVLLVLIVIFIASIAFIIQKKNFYKRIVVFLFLQAVGLKLLSKSNFMKVSPDQLVEQSFFSHYGSLIYFLKTCMDFRTQSFQKKIPADVSSNYFLVRSEALLQKESKPQQKRADFFVVLNESTFDPLIVNSEMNLIENLSFFKKSKNLVSHLPLKVQTFGGGTHISEFNFITGLNANDFTQLTVPIPFSIVPFVQETLFSALKDNGYYTIVLYPVHGSFFAARKSYLKYGVDEFWDSDDLGIMSHEWAVSDTFLFPYFYKKIDELRKVTSKPLFVIMLTMNNHGPHNRRGIKGLLPKDIEKEKWSQPFSDYILRFLDTKKAHQEFMSRYLFRNDKRPSVLLSFGDHLPSFEGEVKNMPFVKHIKDPLYHTFFSLWSNAPISREMLKDKRVDIFFLGGLMLDLLKLKKSKYFEANTALRRLCHSTLDECDPKLYESYQHYIYKDLKVLR